jgi:putative transposase
MRQTADRHPEAGRVELWFMDEARIGQKGRLTHVWYQKGVRPRGVRRQGFASAHLFGAVCPERGEGVALALPESLPRTRSGVSTAAMSTFLAELSRAVPAGTHAALVPDGAGWHVSDDLSVPANLTLTHPPPHSPELNPVERVWEYLRDRWLSHRVLANPVCGFPSDCVAEGAIVAPGRSLQRFSRSEGRLWTWRPSSPSCSASWTTSSATCAANVGSASAARRRSWRTARC